MMNYKGLQIFLLKKFLTLLLGGGGVFGVKLLNRVEIQNFHFTYHLINSYKLILQKSEMVNPGLIMT